MNSIKALITKNTTNQISDFKFQIVRWRLWTPTMLVAPIFGLFASTALAGARIDLRPTPTMPLDGYEPNTVVRVDVYLVDTGNPPGEMAFAHINLDVTDTFAGGDLMLSTFEDSYCCGCPNYFEWASGPCVDECDGCPLLIRSSWIHLPSGFQFVLPHDSEVYLGRLEVNVGELGGTLDIANADDPYQFAGAYAHLDSHHPGGPSTLWRAYTGELTGGQLTMTVNSGGPLQIVSSNPAQNAIDARQPSDASGMQDYGWSQVELTFNGTLCGPEIFDFYLTEQGGDGYAPFVLNVSYDSPESATVYFFPSIEPGAWTTIHHAPSGASMRIGSLPGDVDSDGTSSPFDILALIDALNGVTSLPIHSTDINRSGVAEPSDILRLIDLLNGAGAFEPWNGVSLP